MPNAHFAAPPPSPPPPPPPHGKKSFQRSNSEVKFMLFRSYYPPVN
jgi:hypothetical protein